MELFVADVYDSHAVQKAFEGASRVVHLATPPSMISNEWRNEKILSQSIAYMQNVLDAMRKNDVRHLTVASSVLVYPPDAPTPIGEEWGQLGHPAESKGGYSWGKRLMEAMAQQAARTYGFKLSIPRFSNIYGPRAWNDAHGDVISKSITHALLGQPLSIFGDGNQTRSFLFVEDCVDGIRLLEEAKTGGEAVNLAPRTGTTILEVTRQILRLTKSDSALERVDAPVGPSRGLFDVRRAEKYGFSATTSLESGLKKTIQHYRKTQPVEAKDRH